MPFLDFPREVLFSNAMCFSYSVHQVQNTLPFEVSNLQIPIPGFFFSGFEHPKLPICTDSERWELAQWGLIPAWAKTEQQQTEIQALTLNARSETAFEKPAFKDAWSKRPCLILANGFFEWQHRGQERIPYYISHQTATHLWFAGLYEDVKIGPQWQRTYTLLTTEARGIMTEIHHTKNRMPVMLPEANLSEWLHGSVADRTQLCLPNDPDFLTAHRVNPLLNKNSPDRNASWAIQSYQKPQTELPF